MNTATRADALARAARDFPFLALPDAGALMELVTLELSHAEILDGFQPYGHAFARALPLSPILHVVSGNTPHAALQSVIRGLLLGAHNRCKLPSYGLPELAAFQRALPPELSASLEFDTELPQAWLDEAAVVIAFGSDDTMAALRSRVRADQMFLAHGHRVSMGIVFDDKDFASVDGAAEDVSLFDQQGCLSPHVLYVAQQPREYAERLAAAMGRFEAHTPRNTLSLSETAAIREVRREVEFRAANGEDLSLWQSAGSSAWTVIFDDAPEFTPSPLNRVVFVKPLPAVLRDALGPASGFLSTIAIWPANPTNAEIAASLGASRVCPLGQMQRPSWTWHQDGLPQLSALVRWIDFEHDQI